MKLTKSQLRKIIKEELGRMMSEDDVGAPIYSGQRGQRGQSAAAQETENRLVQVLLDYQEIFGDAYTAKSLREMADDIEAGR